MSHIYIYIYISLYTLFVKALTDTYSRVVLESHETRKLQISAWHIKCLLCKCKPNAFAEQKHQR